MKKVTIFSIFTLLFAVSTFAQDAVISNNIIDARKTDGVELFQNGAIKIKIDVNRIDGYYKWAATTDSLYSNIPIKSWDKESLLAFENSYNSLDLSQVNSQYKLWMKAVRNDKQYASIMKSKYTIGQRY
jgi:hypothetical protein